MILVKNAAAIIKSDRSGWTSDVGRALVELIASDTGSFEKIYHKENHNLTHGRGLKGGWGKVGGGPIQEVKTRLALEVHTFLDE